MILPISEHGISEASTVENLKVSAALSHMHRAKYIEILVNTQNYN